jgi:hypothetical protein
MIEGLLIIVPCGKRKIWDKYPDRGPTPARDAYIGSPFAVNRRYAEHFAKCWLILSAKYGFISPDFVIPGPYNVTFKKRSSNPIDLRELLLQVDRDSLWRFPKVVGLGGADYRSIIEEVFEPWPTELAFPFAGLRQGPAMSATNSAISRNIPWEGHSGLPIGR